MRHVLAAFGFLLGLAAVLCHSLPAVACTGLRLKAKDGTIVYGRTLEFGMDLHSKPIIVSRQLPFQGTAAEGRPGLTWTSKYAAVGLNALGVDMIVDGVNEKGLAGGIFYLPGYAQYQEVTEADAARTLGPWELVTWLLTNFATVDEVRSALPQIRVGSIAVPGLGSVLPMHYIMHDAAGQSLVIEYVKGQLNLYDNPIGVITNSPEFSWHLTNLRNYVGLRPSNTAPLTIDDVTFQALGQGSGLFGLPGDYTPASRFIRATVLGHTALAGENGDEAIRQLFHVLDSFDITLGSVEDIDDDKRTYEFTSWTSASDLKSRTFYFHTYDNRRIRRVELMKADLNADHVLTFPAITGQDYQDVLPAAGSD
jgi:choloylglycine hydrolase